MTAREGQDWRDPTRAMQTRRVLDDALRRALHAAVDPDEPADDGLTRIMRRLTTPSAMRQARLLVIDCVDLARLITIWLEPAFTAAMRLRRRHYAGYPPGAPDHQPDQPEHRTGGKRPGSHRRPLGRWRPWAISLGQPHAGRPHPAANHVGPGWTRLPPALLRGNELSDVGLEVRPEGVCRLSRGCAGVEVESAARAACPA